MTVIVLVVVLIVLLTEDDDRDVPGAGVGGDAEVLMEGRAFRVGGDAVEPLSPGRIAPIDVEFTNPHDDELRVTRLRVRVRAVTAPNADEDRPCSRHDFAVRQVRSTFAVSVAAGETSSLTGLGVPRAKWPRVRMVNRPVDQDGCKGASITLAYRAIGSFGR